MDALAAFLDGPRARAAFLLKVVLEPPWSLRIEDEAPLAVLAVTSGRAHLVPLGPGDPMGAPLALEAGDVAIVRGPEPYVLADRSDRAPTIVIDAAGRCQTLAGEPLHEAMDLGVRTWGNRPDGSDVMLVGTYQTGGEISRWLLDALPRALVLRAGEWSCPAIPLLTAEIACEEPGQQVVLDRLLDLLLVSALRAAFAHHAIEVPPWFSANADPIVGRVIRLMQNRPEEAWTVASLARAVGVSRALLARRFGELVGTPPMAFLTAWRLALAADLLVDGDATVTSVAPRVGYSSPFTFSTAFKRRYGTSPRDYRERATAGTAGRLRTG